MPHMPQGLNLTLIRHAPVQGDGRIYGRRDLAADLAGSAQALARLRDRLSEPGRLLTSPARRCRETAVALWPDLQADPLAEAVEQDFGAWEGLAYADMPDLGVLDRAQLAAHQPPEGESFAMLCARVAAGLAPLTGPVTLVAHAGTVRAALALALGSVPAGLAFEVVPLSVTRISFLAGGESVVQEVNTCA